MVGKAEGDGRDSDGVLESGANNNSMTGIGEGSPDPALYVECPARTVVRTNERHATK